MTVDVNGNFKTADSIENNAETIFPIPAGKQRTGTANVPNPFSDELQYLGGDFCDFSNVKKDKFSSYKKNSMIGIHPSFHIPQ